MALTVKINPTGKSTMAGTQAAATAGSTNASAILRQKIVRMTKSMKNTPHGGFRLVLYAQHEGLGAVVHTQLVIFIENIDKLGSGIQQIKSRISYCDRRSSMRNRYGRRRHAFSMQYFLRGYFYRF